jgi:mannose-1-phosphate guanylyltransferase
MNEIKNNFALIMAGGVGSRFWPTSKTSFPKQFLDLTGVGRSLLQQTFDRLEGIVPPDQIYVLTNERYKSLVTEQLPNIGLEHIICEPAMRNTAPCLLYGALKIHDRNPNACTVVLPSDHFIGDLPLFKKDVLQALTHASLHNELLTFGIPPISPHTGYGYLEVEDKDKPFTSITTFTEKPSEEKAIDFFRAGNYFWNSGIFVWSTQVLLEGFKNFQPAMLSLFQAGIPTFGTKEEQAFLDAKYQKAESISIDYAILEKAQNISMIKASFSWNDLGTWASLYDQLTLGKEENVSVNAKIIAQESKGNMVYSSKDKLIVVKGLEDFVIVDQEDILLICPKGDDQSIKQLRDKAKDLGDDSIV